MWNKVGMVSLGCAKNQVDAEIMLGLLRENGYKIVNESSQADILIVNTCGFIGPAKEESINAILEQGQYKKTGSCRALIVSGCLGERYSRELMKGIPEIDAVVGTGNYTRIIEVLEDVRKGKHQAYLGHLNDFTDEGLPRIISTTGPVAYLKIAEGCDNCCSYCIIPRLRGRFRSRKPSSIVKEAKSMVEKGIREFIIVAQDVTRYGEDSKGKYNLVTLLQELCPIPDLKRIRLMYCYPDRITGELMDEIAGENKVCNYLDIPIQHVNSKILSGMNRDTTEQQIRMLLKSLRERMPGIVIRTSLMVGFPGEGESEFQDLLNFVREGHFNHVGVFAYSREEGTRAADFPNQVKESVKEERRIRLMSAQRQVSRKWMTARLGQICEVLVEGREKEGLYYGRSCGEAPEVDGLIYIRSQSPLPIGSFVNVVIKKAYDYDLMGEVYESRK